jgi:hypothetical protein
MIEGCGCCHQVDIKSNQMGHCFMVSAIMWMCTIYSNGRTVGACLDRNGLRPARYWRTKDDLVYVASEVPIYTPYIGQTIPLLFLYPYHKMQRSLHWCVQLGCPMLIHQYSTLFIIFYYHKISNIC